MSAELICLSAHRPPALPDPQADRERDLSRQVDHWRNLFLEQLGKANRLDGIVMSIATAAHSFADCVLKARNAFPERFGEQPVITHWPHDEGD